MLNAQLCMLIGTTENEGPVHFRCWCRESCRKWCVTRGALGCTADYQRGCAKLSYSLLPDVRILECRHFNNHYHNRLRNGVCEELLSSTGLEPYYV